MSTKILTLIKQTRTIQLGHLYEHLFCSAVDEYFRKHGAFPYLDYRLVGKTYHGGIIYIECTLYTDRAISLSEQITHLNIDTTEDAVHLHISQIMAELEMPMGGRGIVNIVKALTELHQMTWADLDEYAATDLSVHRRQAGPLYIAEGKPNASKKLRTNVRFNASNIKTHRHLLPLFNQFALLVNACLQSEITSTHGYFSYDDKFNVGRTYARLENIYLVERKETVDIDAVANTITTTYARLANTDAGLRLMQTLRSVSYTDNFLSSPDFERNYEATLFAVGAKGWRELATDQNLKIILSHISLEIRYGNTTSTISL